MLNILNCSGRKTYHRDVFWPKNVIEDLPTGTYRVTYSLHALQEAIKDKYRLIPELPKLTLIEDNFIEAYYSYEDPEKFLYRTLLDGGDDLCLIMKIENGEIFVITQWINKSSDQHKTLDKRKYAQVGNK